MKDPITLIASALEYHANLIVTLLDKCSICATPATIRFSNAELTSSLYCDRCTAKRIIEARRFLATGCANPAERQFANSEMWIDLPTADSTRYIVRFVSLLADPEVQVH